MGAGGEALGAGVAEDLEHMRAGRGGGHDGGGGGERRLRRHCGRRWGQEMDPNGGGLVVGRIWLGSSFYKEDHRDMGCYCLTSWPAKTS